MEQASKISFSSPFTFDWTIPNISKLKTTFSPEFVIQGTQWKIEIRKIRTRSKQYVRAFFHCTKTNIPSNWSQAASAVIELLAVDGNANGSSTIVFKPFVVDHSMLRYSSHRIFEIENKYVQNDTIKFNIKIAVDSNEAANKSVLKSESLRQFCKCGSTAKFRVTVTNVEHLMDVRSSDFVLNGVTSHLVVRRDYSSRLGIRLNSTQPCMATLTTTLISSKKSIKPIVRSISNEKLKTILQRTTSIRWLELLKPENGFAGNGSITLANGKHINRPREQKHRNSSAQYVRNVYSVRTCHPLHVDIYSARHALRTQSKIGRFVHHVMAEYRGMVCVACTGQCE